MRIMKPRVVVVGRSNVGKSTLVRALTGDKRVKIGKRPGVTLKINEYDLKNYTLVDMPGFGYVKVRPKKVEERIKDMIVRYLEENSDNIAAAIHVLDGKSFVQIVERWKDKEIPIDIEMFDFITDLKISPILVVNKMDKVKNKEETLNKICEYLKLSPPWHQWKFIVPACLKKNEGIEEIKKLINKRVELFKKLK